MKIIDDIKAVKKYQNIKNGKVEKMSISQVTGLITNMMDAKKNLTKEEYDKVFELFNKLRSCSTKIEMDKEELYKTIMDIIEKFDKIAPYEKYSGGNENEIAFLMDDIHNEKNNMINDISNEMNLESDLRILVDGSNGMINDNIGKKFLDIIMTNVNNKEKLLSEFDSFSNILIDEEPIMSLSSISYMLGILTGNNIITKDEMNQLSIKYQKIIEKRIKGE